MPMYDFQCTKCEHVFEEIVPSDGPFPACPECKSPTDRMITVPNFKVKTKSDKAAFYAKKAKDEWKEKSGHKQVFPVAGKPQKKKSP